MHTQDFHLQQAITLLLVIRFCKTTTNLRKTSTGNSICYVLLIFVLTVNSIVLFREKYLKMYQSCQNYITNTCRWTADVLVTCVGTALQFASTTWCNSFFLNHWQAVRCIVQKALLLAALCHSQQAATSVVLGHIDAVLLQAILVVMKWERHCQCCSNKVGSPF